MPYDNEKADFKAIAGNAKKSDAFKSMGGGDSAEPDADDDGGDETADLGDAYAAVKSGSEDSFKASMLAAIRSCIATYGTKK